MKRLREFWNTLCGISNVVSYYIVIGLIICFFVGIILCLGYASRNNHKYIIACENACKPYQVVSCLRDNNLNKAVCRTQDPQVDRVVSGW